MALLSKFIDISTGLTFGPNSGIAGPIYQTLAHSLGTTPDKVSCIVVSIGPGTLPVPQALGVGGNASIATVMLAASTLGNSTMAFSVESKYYYSTVR